MKKIKLLSVVLILCLSALISLFSNGKITIENQSNIMMSNIEVLASGENYDDVDGEWVWDFKNEKWVFIIMRRIP